MYKVKSDAYGLGVRDDVWMKPGFPINHLAEDALHYTET